ncbi:uncharacterized protein LOC111529859 [Piliocolobus tephrosceles]|uniref:uncharacterized protein LOC111529859 n=1 Tax=Piliocolobus tephrosceles TaxID=591936 RepID=UPI000E6B05F0|nr:uncharacterized protein LOC111529859 [Piliocolobus tephrosceles]
MPRRVLPPILLGLSWAGGTTGGRGLLGRSGLQGAAIPPPAGVPLLRGRPWEAFATAAASRRCPLQLLSAGPALHCPPRVGPSFVFIAALPSRKHLHCAEGETEAQSAQLGWPRSQGRRMLCGDGALHRLRLSPCGLRPLGPASVSGVGILNKRPPDFHTNLSLKTVLGQMSAPLVTSSQLPREDD